jgi:hypothetical protein
MHAQRQMDTSEHDSIQPRLENIDPLAVRPVVPASALASPEEVPQPPVFGTSSPPPPPPGQPAWASHDVLMTHAHGPRQGTHPYSFSVQTVQSFKESLLQLSF